MTVADQNVMAINPADEPKTHMYIWNSIFYSLGFDVKDHYKVCIFMSRRDVLANFIILNIFTWMTEENLILRTHLSYFCKPLQNFI